MLSKEIPLSFFLNEMNVLGKSRDKFSPEERGVRDHMFRFHRVGSNSLGTEPKRV